MSDSRLSHAYGTGSNVEITQPAQALQRTGYSAGDVPPNDEFNWLIGHKPLLFISMETAADELKEGQVAIINDPAPETKRLGSRGVTASYANALSTMDIVIATGRHIIAAPYIDGAQYKIAVLNESDLSEVYTIDIGNPNIGICTDGEFIYVSDGTNIVKRALATGTAVWSKANTDHILATDGERLFSIGGTGSGNAVNAYNCSDGLVSWNGWTEAGEEVFGLYSNGLQLFIASYDSGGTSGEVRAVDAATGNGASGAGGIGTSTDDWVWNETGTNVQASTGSRIVPLGQHRIAVTGDTSATKIEVFGRLAGGSIATWAAPADVWVAADHAYLYATSGTGSVAAFDFDLNLVAGVTVSATDLEGIAADGNSVYLLTDEGSPDYQIAKHCRPDYGALQVYKREPDADVYWPLNDLVLHPMP